MKHIFPYISLLLLAVSFLASCSDDDVIHPSEAGIPLVTDLDVTIMVDQSINQVTFSINNKGCMPVWIFDGKEYSTVNGMSKIYPKAGEYTVDIKAANANGISDGIITKTFTINNTIIDYSGYIKRLAGDDSKEWMIAKNEVGHIGCGESGSDGLGWYSATPNDKAAFGLYDDIVTFTTDKSYGYNPGDGGTVFVNKECSIFNEFNTTGEDFMAKVDPQTATYDFDIIGDDIYITLPAQTLFPYIPNDGIYNNPRYKIKSITPSKLELIADNGEIAWHFTLSSGSENKPAGYNPNHECNMWRNATFTNEFWYAPGWNQIADPGFEVNGNSYKITLPEATSDTWQAQVKFLTDLETNSANNYDFSINFNANKDHKNVTVKLVKTGDDNIYYFLETVKLKAYEDVTLIKSDLPGLDMDNVSLVFDFGGNESGTEVTISRVVLKEHSCDDGTVITPPTEEEDVIWLPDAASNLWNSTSPTLTCFYAPGWTQIADPKITIDANLYKIELPTATSDQWQAQVLFHTDISTNAQTAYDFRCILNATKDMRGVTIKLADDTDDDLYFFIKRIDINAYEEVIFKMPNLEGVDISKIKLVFDFGGNAENSEITVSSIILQEHGSGKVIWKPESACNLWKQATYNNTYFYAPGWSQIADPKITVNGNSYKIALPTATSEQWQAQVLFHSDMSSNAATNYDFHCILNANQDMQNVTVKLTQEGNDDVFYFTKSIALSAFEDYIFEQVAMPGIDIDKINVVFDFGGNPENTEVTISNIILKESGCNN